ncbi:MAG: YafY family protein [Chloroflexota bacterium]
MYHPTTRLLTILGLLQAYPLLSGPELARRLEVDVRTVRRYIMMLQDMGIPIETTRGPGGGYSLRPGYKLPPLMFSEEEAAAIVLGLLGSAWLEIDQSTVAIEGALAKILRVLPHHAREQLTAVTAHTIFSPHEHAAHPNTDLMLQLSEAAQQQKRIKLTYISQKDKITKRMIEPYSLAGWWGVWYLVAFCCLRQDYRLFRLDRMSDVQTLQQVFVRKEKFDSQAYVINQLGQVSDGWHIKIEFADSKQAVQAKFPEYFGTLTETPSGVFFECQHGDLDEMARFFAGLNLPFTVHNPPELRQALLQLAEQLIQNATVSDNIECL